VQTHHVIGVEIRGSILRWGGGEHQESALAGPRAGLRFGRISPYASVLVGAANAWFYPYQPGRGLPTPPKIEGVGFQWAVLGGLDVRLNHKHQSSSGGTRILEDIREGQDTYTAVRERGRRLSIQLAKL